MGKSIELLGLAAFNIFIALILSATFLKGNAGVPALTETNVTQFITEVSHVAGGQRADMDQFSITEYFMAHIADHGMFTSTIEFSLPDETSSSRRLEMDKNNYISHTLEGMKTMSKRETAVTIEYIKIAENGKSATVTTTNYERGVMPVEDGFGEAQMLPVTGTSYCEQELVLTENVIQMAAANCSTSIDFFDSY